MLCKTVLIIFLGAIYLKPTQENEAALALLPNLTVCGIQNPGRIVGDIQTKIDEHPWTALIVIDKHFVKPICLPTSTELRRSTFETYDVEVAGWGTSETGMTSDVKLKARIPVAQLSRCAINFYKLNRIVTDNHLCAGGSPGPDTCKVDSGGALMGTVPGSQNWMALGVFSYGPSPCGSPDWPGVYTRVSAYIDWINSKLKA